MSKPLNITVKGKGKSHFDISKELEIVNFETMELENNKYKRNISKEERRQQFIKCIKSFSITKYFGALKRIYRGDFKNQQSAFRGASLSFIIIGHCLGLNPVTGALGKDLSKIRLEMISIKYIYSVIMCILQILATVFCFINLVKTSVTITTFANFIFYFTTSVTGILFLCLARKWQLLKKEVTLSHLDEYIDQSIQFKCTVATVGVLCFAFFEHILSVTSRLAHLTDCTKEIEDILQMYTERYFNWFFQLNVQYNVVLGIILTLTNLICALNWNYSQVFIICISLYLSSIFEQINKKLLSTQGQFMPSSYWKSLREDYNSATRLVRTFDDNINCITFVAFASNLFFVCLRLFYALSNGLNFGEVPDKNCPNYPSGLLNGYESVIYLLFSLVLMLSRSFLVSLITSRVHSASLVAAPILYAVPSPVYCLEVQRFIEQVHGETVALTGMNFFQVTRELVLSIAGTIVTYELVLLQLT